ncbi:MAG: prephenate dehydratase [Symploca sp. SIO2E9]|nr:prephenate dehydratase [Symploca sp. SIO2E9]
MSVSIAYLGPPGTYTEAAALAYVGTLAIDKGFSSPLCPYPSIAQTLSSVVQGKANLAVVPVENSIEGSVTVTLDLLWQLDQLKIQKALVLPVKHALLSRSSTLAAIKTICSHPQALAQCQGWLERFLPSVQLIPTNSTTEALKHLDQDLSLGAIASHRAAQLYKLPILASGINDHPENCTKFWVLGLQPAKIGSHTSVAFSLAANVPGVLVKPLQVFAARGINLSRIESRPTKRSLGEYLFFIDLEAHASKASVQAALSELASYSEILKVFGSYSVLPIDSPEVFDD